MEGGAAAASRVPHAADGLVRAAAVADQLRRQRGYVGSKGAIPDVNQLRIPVKYLANLLTAGDTAPVVRALERMLAMRAYQREKHVDGRINHDVLSRCRSRRQRSRRCTRDGDRQL